MFFSSLFRDENEHARKELLEKLEELKKEQTEFMERQNKLIMSMKEIESEKTNLKRKLEEKDCVSKQLFLF